MGKKSAVCYGIYLIIFAMFSMPLSIVLHLHLLYDDEKNLYSPSVLFLWYISFLLGFAVLSNNKLVATAAKRFVRHRYLLAGAMIILNILMIVNSVFRLVGLWENVSFSISFFLTREIVVAFMVAMGIMYLPFSTLFHINTIEFECSYLKSTKLSKKQWLVLLGFHTLLAVFYTTLFLFDESCLGKKELVQNFRFIRSFCQVINILSIPMSYQAILSWNSDKLKFKGKYPNTTRKWTGLMKRNPDGKWEIDQTPEDHNVFIV
ncbi:hypothetical protein CRE_24627 [Caenorhabditis remanei]|uniref:Uncharacterized protein n=1 Tax=Caenorhabditis remanei TaxID=31234 RepID=E3MV66_CAERE|nr:hypothetical protein CRE_24627 [Caenorhabditis remanei]